MSFLFKQHPDKKHHPDKTAFARRQAETGGTQPTPGLLSSWVLLAGLTTVLVYATI